MGLAVLALRLCRLHRGRVLAALHKLLEPLSAEPDHEVVAMSDHGNCDPTAQRAPLSQRFNVLCDVELLELTTAYLEPSLGIFAVGSRRGGVDSDLGHSSHLEGVGVGLSTPSEDAPERWLARILFCPAHVRLQATSARSSCPPMRLPGNHATASEASPSREAGAGCSRHARIVAHCETRCGQKKTRLAVGRSGR